MRLRIRIVAPVALLAGVAILLAVVALWLQTRVGEVVDQLTRESQVALHASEARSVSRALQRDALNAIFEPEAGRAAILTRFDRRVGEFTKHVSEVRSRLAPADLETLKAYPTLQADVLNALKQVRDLAEKGQREPAHAAFLKDVRDRERAASELTDPFIDAKQLQVAALAAEAEGVRAMAFQIMLWGSLAGILLATGFSLFQAGAVTRAIHALTGVIERMALKDLSGGGAARHARR